MRPKNSVTTEVSMRTYSPIRDEYKEVTTTSYHSKQVSKRRRRRQQQQQQQQQLFFNNNEEEEIRSDVMRRDDMFRERSRAHTSEASKSYILALNYHLLIR